MMDDSMEISSEQGHNIRDEDIDIDIDLTAGHVDEDYVLEDAASHAAFEDDFHSHLYPVAANDDLMVDEDHDPYLMVENDADLVPDDSTGHVDDDAAHVPLGPANTAASNLDDSERLDTSHFENAVAREAEVMWDHRGGASVSVIQTDVHLQTHELVSHKDEDHLREVNAADAVASTADLSNDESKHTVPRNRSLRAPPANEHQKSPSAAVIEPVEEPTVIKNDPGTTTSYEHGENIPGESHAEYPSVELNILPQIPEISVLYQNTEYALFSTPELDDPDSFFLSDLSIIDAPLSNFLEAIRDVIHEDLTDEDELCLSMGDLGIEVEETSKLIDEITLRQILTLSEELLRNDGIQSPPPFCIQFSIRPNFSKRLARLAAGVAEGKGLSELIQWAKQSESPEYSAEAAENDHVEDANVETHEPEEFHEVEGGHEDVQDSSDIPQTTAPNTGIKSGPNAADTSDNLNDSLNKKSTTQEHTDSTTHTPPKAETTHNMNGSGKGDYNEEDDLIDYSDEETQNLDKSGKTATSQVNMLESVSSRRNNGTSDDFISTCFKPNTCFCSKCNDLLLAEYEAINEELRRRSVSHAAEDSLLEQSAEQTEAGQDYNDYQVAAAATETGVEYEDDKDEAYSAEPELYEGDPESSTTRDAVGGEDLEGNSPWAESQDGFKSNEKNEDVEIRQENLEEEIEYGEDHEDENARDHPQLSDKDLGLDDSPKKPSGDEHAGVVALGHETAPESGGSEEILEALTSTDETVEDEIDYDDDDEQDTSESYEPLPSTKEFPVPIDGSGKRQREDADLDEGMSMSSKETKRRKS